jgi:hypothetical protein
MQYNLAYLIFIMMGAGAMFPWNAFLSALDFWNAFVRDTLTVGRISVHVFHIPSRVSVCSIRVSTRPTPSPLCKHRIMSRVCDVHAVMSFVSSFMVPNFLFSMVAATMGNRIHVSIRIYTVFVTCVVSMQVGCQPFPIHHHVVAYHYVSGRS